MPGGRPRNHPLGTPHGEVKRQSRARIGVTTIEVGPETVGDLDRIAAATGETRRAIVARLAREAAP